jgi:hypothetical protein
MTIIRLEWWEHEWAMHVAKRRTEANLGKGNAQHYDDARLQDDYTADRAAAAAEMAVAKHLNRYWPGTYWDAEEHADNANMADVGHNIEVRCITNPAYRLQIRQVDVERERAMVLAFPHRPDCFDINVIGWGWATELWDKAEPAQWDKSQATRLVHQRHLVVL